MESLALIPSPKTDNTTILWQSSYVRQSPVGHLCGLRGMVMCVLSCSCELLSFGNHPMGSGCQQFPSSNSWEVVFCSKLPFVAIMCINHSLRPDGILQEKIYIYISGLLFFNQAASSLRTEFDSSKRKRKQSEDI